MINEFHQSRTSRGAISPVAFKDDATGFAGWRIAIESRRAIPSPAIAHDRLFVGGGFGSHDFYSFDARSGAPAWRLHTSDHGPTATVVPEGSAVFNTGT